MPKKRTSKVSDFDQGPLEKSLSNPEISEIAKEFNRMSAETEDDEANRREYMEKPRKGSWFSRLLRTFRRKRRKTVDAVFPQSSTGHPVQKSSSAQFYTPPSSEFLVKAITVEDDVDTSRPTRGNQGQSSRTEIKRATITRGSERIYDKPPNFMDELIKTLDEDVKKETVKKVDEPPTYGNMTDIKNPASKRRKPRPLSDETIEQRMADLDSIYEPTWKVMPKDKKPKSILKSPSKTDVLEEKDVNRVPDLEPQPIKPLFDRFSKPKPPVNRRPSSRRGSQPDVEIRRRMSENDLFETNRRSNAELEEVLQRLNQIPAPVPEQEQTPITPTPRVRTKFFKSGPDSPPVDKMEDRSIEDKEIEKSEENELWEKDFVRKIERGDMLDEEQERRIPLTRNNSYPRIKLLSGSTEAMVVVFGTLKDETKQDNKNKSGSCDNLEFSPFKRWNTMPTRYYLNSKEPKNSFVKPSTIVVLPLDDRKKDVNDQVEGDMHEITLTLNSQVRPTTQSISTQTCSTISSEIIHISTVELDSEALEDQGYEAGSPLVESPGQSTPPNTPEHEYSENQLIEILKRDSNDEDTKETVDRQEVRGYATRTRNESTCSNSDNGKSTNFQVTSESLSKFRSNLKHVEREEGYSSVSKGSTIIQNQTFTSSVNRQTITTQIQNTVVSGQNFMTHDTKPKEIPIKPQRLSRKPPITPKPELPFKPHDFTRRGAVRQKRHSENQVSPINVAMKDDPLNNLTENPEKRRSSLFQDPNTPQVLEMRKEIKRNKSIM